MSQNNQSIQLNDGRRLGYAEWGDPGGYPVLLFGGSSSRLFHHPDNSIAINLGVRLITVERPGFGLSDPKPQRRVLDWAEDVKQLMDTLQIERFAVIGGSQGGPFALACAYALAERLSAAFVISGIAPFHVKDLNKDNPFMLRMLPKLATRAPFLIHAMTAMGVPMMRRYPEKMVQQTFKNLPPSDQTILKSPELMAMFTQDMPEVFRQGGVGAAHDIMAVCTDWGFALEAIKMPVHIWQGDADPNATMAMAQYMAQTIPNSSLKVIPGAGHMLFVTHWREILEQVREAINSHQ